MQNNASSSLLKRLEAGYALRPLSAIALKLVEMASDENASLKDMVGLIEKDPALAVRLLNVANTAFFSSGGYAGTLLHAAMKLGTHRLRIMGLSLSLRDAFPMGKVECFDYEQFWRASLYRGLVAKCLAERSKVCNPDEAFLAALTLEIGLPVLFDLSVRRHRTRIDLELEPLEELLSRERSAFGVDHRQVGRSALRYWKFPPHLVACQDFYGEAARTPNTPILCSVCEIARLFSKMLFQRSSDFDTFFVEAEKLLKIPQDILADIVLDTFSEVEGIAEGFRVSVDNQVDLMEVMEKANGALIRISEKLSRYPQAFSKASLPTFDSLDPNEPIVTHTLQAVIHEIRNPLTAVGGFARRLAMATDPKSDVAKYAHLIMEEASRLEKILSNMT